MIGWHREKQKLIADNYREFPVDLATYVLGPLMIEMTRLRVAYKNNETDTVLNSILSLEDEAIEAHGRLKLIDIEDAAERDVVAKAANDAIERLKIEAAAAKPHEMHPIADPEVRAKVWALTNGKCAYCDKDIPRDGVENRADRFCVEHVVPTSSGGPDNLANYVPACISCNSAKGDRHVLTLVRRMQRRTDLVVVADNSKEASA